MAVRAISGSRSRGIAALRAMACARRSVEGWVSHFSLHLLHCIGCMLRLASLKRAEMAASGSPVASTAPASAENSKRRDLKAGAENTHPNNSPKRINGAMSADAAGSVKFTKHKNQQSTN